MLIFIFHLLIITKFIHVTNQDFNYYQYVLFCTLFQHLLLKNMKHKDHLLVISDHLQILYINLLHTFLEEVLILQHLRYQHQESILIIILMIQDLDYLFYFNLLMVNLITLQNLDFFQECQLYQLHNFLKSLFLLHHHHKH